MTTKCEHPVKHIVIVGAGAGGLELATRLGNTVGKSGDARITLINPTLTHLWKPLWHEVAAGTFDFHEDELNLVVHAYTHHFHFQLGAMECIDRENKKIILSSLKEQQQVILPERFVNYDIAVIAVGCDTNDFNVPGVKEYCFMLDSPKQVERFQQAFLKSFIVSQNPQQVVRDKPLSIAIIGGGATGVELAAELHYAALQATKYGWAKIKDKPIVQISIIESASSILSNLSKDIIEATTNELKKRNIEIITDERVISVNHEGIYTQRGRYIPAEFKIWVAGIKAPAFLTRLNGLETNALNQLKVKTTLQTIADPAIFAMGDCASCPIPNQQRTVPPRAQAANQQAKFLEKSLRGWLKGKPLQQFIYHDYGSIVTLSDNQTYGSLMGKAGGKLFISGRLARLTYRYLYREHQAVLHGWWRVLLMIIASFLTKPVRPRLKLH